jgi:hypothetical protein
MSAEHEAAVGRSPGKENVSFEDEVGVLFFGDEEELFVTGEVEFAIDDFHFAPVIWIIPTFGGFTVKESGPFVGGRGIDGLVFFLAAVGEEEREGRENEKADFHKNEW